jgi:hypothetical protein
VHRRRRSDSDRGGAGLTRSTLSEAEVQRRLPVWFALADLFLDTWFDPPYYEKIAATLRASGFSEEELRMIFYDEVTPAFAFNLFDIAGEWAGWHEQFVRERMLATIRKNEGLNLLGWFSKWRLKRYVDSEWEKLRPLVSRSR